MSRNDSFGSPRVEGLSGLFDNMIRDELYETVSLASFQFVVKGGPEEAAMPHLDFITNAMIS